MSESVLILEDILQAGDRIAERLGDAWPDFRAKMAKILDSLMKAEEELLPLWVDELLELGLDSPAADVFRQILRQSQAKTALPKDHERAYRLTAVSNAALSGTGLGPHVLRQAAAELSSILMPQEQAKGIVGDQIVADQTEGIFIEAEETLNRKGLPSPRYLNAGLFAGDAPLSTDQPPILEDGPYRLGVNVGEFWGPGHPDDAVPEHLLQSYFEKEGTLEMDVAVRSLDVTVTPELGTLDLPREGDSSLIFFDLEFTRTGRQAINIDLLFRGHLLQSRRVEVEAVAHAGVELPESAWPVQDGYVTFTRAAMLEPDTLKTLDENPRTLTVVAERDLDYNRIGLRFYDATGTELGFQQSTLADANLTRMLAAVRRQMVRTMDAYAGTVGSTERVLTKHLGQLAEVGRKFYLALLPRLANQDDMIDDGQRLDIDLEPGAVIQVAPLSGQVGVPWELLYERRIESYREGRTRLCSTFREHGPAYEDCPSHDDSTVVCPHGFWGYRYIVEQLPCRVAPHKSIHSTLLPLQIRNDLPSRLNVNFSTRLRQIHPHLRDLRDLAPEAHLELIQGDSLDDVRQALLNTDKPTDIVYFYAHGGDDCGSPYLEVGEGDQIQLIDLDAWRITLHGHRPLVVLNACESADYAPDSFENLIQFFCDAGAAGVIGTQCEVREKLAQVFIIHFFQSFFAQVSAGQALFEARHLLLHDYLDPRGLTYGLFASADVKLAQPIIA